MCPCIVKVTYYDCALCGTTYRNDNKVVTFRCPAAGDKQHCDTASEARTYKTRNKGHEPEGWCPPCFEKLKEDMFDWTQS